MIQKLREKFNDYRIRRTIAVRDDLKNSFLTIPVEVKKGRYKGLIYRYGVVTIPKDGVVKFEFQVLQNGHLIDDNFVQFAGKVLTYIYISNKYHEIVSNQDGFGDNIEPQD